MGEKTPDPREYYKAKYQTLEDLPGIGPAGASKLRQAGFKTVQAVATANQMELKATGIGEETAAKVIKAARMSLEVKYVTGAELLKLHKDRRKITTGVKSLDMLLEGGILTESITEFYGEFGSGKSQICQQLAVTVQLPVEEGGLDGGCLYIDTENVFTPNRIMDMATHVGVDPKSALKRIIYAGAFTSEHQMVLLNAADEVVKENNIRLIIVDSVMGHFRSEYIGRETLAPRQGKLNQHLHSLKRLCRAFNAAGVVTNQVMAIPDSSYGPQGPKAAGGNIMGHASHTRIFLRKGRNNLRIAKIMASPFLPEGEAPFRIMRLGITDDEDIAG